MNRRAKGRLNSACGDLANSMFGGAAQGENAYRQENNRAALNISRHDRHLRIRPYGSPFITASSPLSPVTLILSLALSPAAWRSGECRVAVECWAAVERCALVEHCVAVEL